MQPATQHRPWHPGGRRQTDRQCQDTADREVGEGFSLERIAAPADPLDRIDVLVKSVDKYMGEPTRIGAVPLG